MKLSKISVKTLNVDAVTWIEKLRQVMLHPEQG